MCNRVAREEQEVEEFSERHRLSGEDVARLLLPTWNAAPGTLQPVVVVDSAGYPRVRAMRWGLLSRRDDGGPTPSNARAETVGDRPRFRDLLPRRRCLVPATGWYEWRREHGCRQPYFLTTTDRRLIAFAGLFDAWVEGEEIVASYCVVTVPPAVSIAHVHHRMPVILHADDEATWLSPTVTEPRRLLPLLRPYLADRLAAYPVDFAVNNPRSDGPDLIRPVDGRAADADLPRQAALPFGAA